VSPLYWRIIDRRDFGALLSIDSNPRFALEPVDTIDALLFNWPPLKQEAVAIWREQPREFNSLPTLLVCSDEAEDDWAAWITTYAGRIRPFTAFIRLINQSEFRQYARQHDASLLPRMIWPMAGLVLGEVLAASRLPDKALETLPANAFESTLAFAMVRALTLYPKYQRWEKLLRDWEFAREATRQPKRSIDGIAVAKIFALIIEASRLGEIERAWQSDNTELLYACREAMESSTSSFLHLPSVPGFERAQETMRGPREDRVIAFSEFLRNMVGHLPTGQEMSAFALGYLASRIAPGTIQHALVLEPVANKYPSAVLWYGFFAGLGSNDPSRAKVATLGLPASARWVARDLLRPEALLDAPTCDVAISELRALSHSGSDPLAGLIRTSLATANIELAPGVWTIVNTSQKTSPEEQRLSARERSSIAAIGEHLEGLRGAYEALLSDKDEPRQQGLFPQKRRRS
jgi:hypothetical protein